MAKRVVISESQLKRIIRESIESVLMDKQPDNQENYDKIRDWAYGMLDYLYNEGVVAYDDANIYAMANDKKPIDYMDIVKVILSEYGTNCDCEAGQILRNYYKLSKKYGESIPEVEDAIKSAIKKFAEDANCDLFI